MGEEEIRERLNFAAWSFVKEPSWLIDEEMIYNIIKQEFADQLKKAFTEVARRIGEIVSNVVGRRVHSEFAGYEFIEYGELFFQSKYRLTDVESRKSGEVKLLGNVYFTPDSVFVLNPVSGGVAAVSMYGGEIDRMIRDAIQQELSEEKIRVVGLREFLEALAGRHEDLLYEGARKREDAVRIAIARELDVNVDNVTVRLFNVELDAEANRASIHYLFRVDGYKVNTRITGMMTFFGGFTHLAGDLVFVPLEASVKYRLEWMVDEEVQHRLKDAAQYLSRIAYGMIREDVLINIIESEIGDKLEPAFTVLEGKIGEAVSGVTGRRVRAEFMGYEFVGEKLFVMSRYRLVDADSRNNGEVELIGRIDVEGGDAFILRPIVEGRVVAEMYGDRIDRQIERAIAERLSQERVRIADYAEVFNILVTKYHDLIYSRAKRHESNLKYALATRFDVDMEDVTVRLVGVSASPESGDVSMLYAFSVRGFGGEVDVTGMVLIEGDFSHLEGYLYLAPKSVDVEYKIHRRGQG